MDWNKTIIDNSKQRYIMNHRHCSDYIFQG